MLTQVHNNYLNYAASNGQAYTILVETVINDNAC